MLMDTEEKWSSYKMEVVIKKGGIQLFKKLIGKRIIIKKEMK